MSNYRIKDELWNDAIREVTLSQNATTPNLQRTLRIGYNLAFEILELMESKGYVGKQDGTKPREVFLKVETNKSNGKDIHYCLNLPCKVRNVEITGAIEL